MSNQGVVSGGYIMGQGPGGVPVAFPVQAAGGVVTVPAGAVGVHPQMHPQVMQPQMVQMPPGGVVHGAGQLQMYPAPAGALGMQPQIVQVPTSGGLVGQAQVVQGQMVQVPTSGAVGGPPPEQMAHAPSGPDGVQSQFVRVTPAGPVKGDQEAFS